MSVEVRHNRTFRGYYGRSRPVITELLAGSFCTWERDITELLAGNGMSKSDIPEFSARNYVARSQAIGKFLRKNYDNKKLYISYLLTEITGTFRRSYGRTVNNPPPPPPPSAPNPE